ncbi:MAG TPA: hypothetical protein VHB46_14515 [Burkholderiales bacterium]|nr:hypothetical protein [Burkholderiales bacterium]
MKLGTPIAALILGLSASAVWADTSRTGAEPAADAANAATTGPNGEQGGWQFTDGKSKDEGNPSAQNANTWSSEDDHSANEGERGVPDQAAADAQDQQRGDQSMAGQQQENSDESAAADQQDETASQEDEGASGQSASLQGSDDEDADQSAQATADNDLMAALPNQGEEVGTQAVPTQAQVFRKFMEATQDKMVVILPHGWAGSVDDLLAVLQHTTDSEIVVLSQRDEEDGGPSMNPTPDDESDNDDDSDDQ